MGKKGYFKAVPYNSNVNFQIVTERQF